MNDDGVRSNASRKTIGGTLLGVARQTLRGEARYRAQETTVRILHISALPVWPMGGKGGMPSLRETLRGHVQGGHNVVLLLPRYQLFLDRPELTSVRHDEGYEVHLAGCSWAPAIFAVRRLGRRLGGGKEVPYVLRWCLNLSMCGLLTVSLILAALRVRRRQYGHFDLVYAHNQYTALAGWLLGLMFRAPNVTRLYGTFLADLMKRPLVWLRYPVAAAGYLVPHSLLICANDGTRGDEVARRLRIDMSRFRFWQNGVDLPEAAPRITREELISRYAAIGARPHSKWAVSCSRLSYWKRIDRMIRALRVARDAGCDCQLLIAGSGSEEERLRALAKQQDVEADIVWLGPLRHDAVWEVMHTADVFMITNDVTNRCNPLYEAICAGLPVVSLHDPSTADLLEEGFNALLANREDVEALGRNLLRLFSDDALAESLRRNQRSTRTKLWAWQERMETEMQELRRLMALPERGQPTLDARQSGVCSKGAGGR